MTPPRFDFDRLAIAFVEFRFVIPRVDLGRASIHKEVDDVLRLRSEVWLANGERRIERGSRGLIRFRLGVTRKETVLIEHPGQSQPGEAGSHLPEKLAPLPRAAWLRRACRQR